MGLGGRGLDCKVRQPNGDVVTELEPNRPDRTCGLFEPGGSYPSPWPTAH
jgi:hypothetical protein